MQDMRQSLYLLLSWLCVSLCLSLPALAAADLGYQLELDLDAETSTLRGKATISYLYQGPKALPSLFFRLDANAQASMEVQEVKTKEGLILPSRPYRYTYLEQQVDDPLLYEVFLTEPLQPGQRVELVFHYVIRHLPRNQGAYYLLDDINQLGLGSWYPRLVPFRDGQWQIYERLYADYEVKARANRKFYVISPLAPVSISNADHSYQYSTEQAREMSLIYTPDMLLRSVEADNVAIRYYYHANLQKWSPMTLELVQSVMRFLRERYGSYPSRRMTIVSIEDSPYPVIVSDQLIVLRNSFSPDADEAVVKRRLAEHLAYGLAQQFWGYQVGQPADKLAWINQGLALFVAQHYLQQQERRPFLLGDALVEDYLRAARQGWNTSLDTPRQQLERLRLDSFRALAQGKGFTLIRQLERLLGKQVMEQTENRLLQQFRGKQMQVADFQKVLQQVSGKDLDWFFRQWVQRSDTLDYAIQSAQQTQLESGGVRAVVVVQKLGQITMPVTLALRLNNGETQLKLWDGSQLSERLSFDLKHPLREVVIDPSQATPDIDRSNNRFELPGMQAVRP
ncbi:MAG: hypothetical protein IGS03_03050 [Candidatus Sericytochromatia bacterium]|nr:hypothetical protein [Candidatus Sericytochromatia bacterium]